MGTGGYLQAVNGTPYRWKKTDGYAYQMLEAKFPDYIDAFTTYTIYVEFAKPFFGNWQDDEAWAEYTMEGSPSHTFFRLWANSKEGHMRFKLRLTGMSTLTGDGPNNNSDIDLGFRQNPTSNPNFNGTTCIIAGVEGAFVTTSRTPFLKGKSWMAHSLATIGDLTLREICLPGSHNSGLSVSRYSTMFGLDRAVLCQSRSIAEQLAYGVRYFDIRPVGRGPEFETGHYSKGPDLLGWQGASGQTIAEIVNQINSFTRENHEIIILNVSHAYDANDGFRDFHRRDWGDLFNSSFDRLEALYEATSPDVDLSKVKIRELTQDGKKAAVIIRFGYGRNDGNAPPFEGRLGKGYFWPENLPIFDEYADKSDPNQLVEDQFAKLQRERGGKAPADGQMFCIGWALTQHTLGDVTTGPSLLEWARDAMTPRFGVLFEKSSKTCYPNIIGMDGVESMDGVAVAVAINTRAHF